MKHLIFILFAVVELQRPLSSCLELLLRKNKVVTQGTHQWFECGIKTSRTNCTGLYDRFFWEARSGQSLVQKIVNDGCVARFTINNTTSSDAGRYKCILITPDKQEFQKELSIHVSPKGKGESCPITQTKCVATGHCIFQRYRCDNFDDCDDGSDEQHCPSDKCADKFVCNNGRCIKKELQCNRQDDCGDNSDEDKRCFQDEISSTEPPAMDDHFDWLKTTVYTVIGCTVAVVIFISFIVIVVFRVKMKRLRARRIARALERHRQHQGSTNQGRSPEQDPFLSIGSNSHYGNIIVNVNNGVQYVPTGDFTQFVDSPPPYHEVVASERDSSPPPPYSTIDRKPNPKPGTSEGTSCEMRDMQQPHTSSDMASIQEDIADLVGAEGGAAPESNPRLSSDLHPPSYPGSASESSLAPTAASALPQSSNRSESNLGPSRDSASYGSRENIVRGEQAHHASRENMLRGETASATSRDNIPVSVDSQPQTPLTNRASPQTQSGNRASPQTQRTNRASPSTNQTSLARPARLAVQGGKILLSPEEEAAANRALSDEGSRPRQCHLEVKEGQIVLTDMTRSDLGVQSPLTADGVVRGTGELEVRDGQIIFRPKET